MQRLSRYNADKVAMLKCGVQALAYVLEKDGKKKEANEISQMRPSSLMGHSLQELRSIAANYSYEFTGLRLTVSELNEIPLPAILQINSRNGGDSGHYWVVEKVDKAGIRLFDPQSGRRFYQSSEELSREWDGNVLVISNDEVLAGFRLAEVEMEQIYGGCCGNPTPESGLGNTGNNTFTFTSNNPPSCPNGAPVWSVNAVNMNVFVTDTPIWYASPVGPSVNINISYNSLSATAQNEPFGNKWSFNYGSYLVVDTGGNVTVFMPDGRRDEYTPDGAGGFIRNVENHVLWAWSEYKGFAIKKTHRYNLS